MSQTYHLCCVTCRESIWIAQGHANSLYFYSGEPNTLIAFNEFLRRHQTTMRDESHELIFTDSENADEALDCREIEVEDDERDPYFYWIFRKGDTGRLVLKEYKGVVVPGNKLITLETRRLLNEGWDIVTVRDTPPTDRKEEQL